VKKEYLLKTLKSFFINKEKGFLFKISHILMKNSLFINIKKNQFNQFTSEIEFSGLGEC